jgi:coenzyme F420-reducing hydrogenase alpha subunit
VTETQTLSDLKVDLHYLTRVEGHGNILVDVKQGKVERCELTIVEAPRFFEAMLVGRPYGQASHLASRICGICSVAHSTASLRAVETALGVEISPQAQLLRRLAFYGEMLDSHILHAYLLVAPDFFDEPSAIALAGKKPEVVVRALRMKRLAGDLCTVLAGRHTHPVALAVGGMRHLPTAAELSDLQRRLMEARADVEATLELYGGLPFPEFSRETEYLALRPSEGYGFIDGDIVSSDGGSWPLARYPEVVREYLVEHSTAKHARHDRPSYMVGALARFRVNHDRLHPRARAAAEALGLTPECANPYRITAAQVVEIVHCVEEAIDVIQSLLDQGLRQEPLGRPTRLSGEGVGAVEAPRGALYHHYLVDDGLIRRANCIIPTNQNLANIEADLRAVVPQILPLGPAAVTQRLEMLVRAYDPCISCATHMLKVEFRDL